MIHCKLCGTVLDIKSTRRDGAVLCPICGQIYWKTALEKAVAEESGETEGQEKPSSEIRKEGRHIRKSKD